MNESLYVPDFFSTIQKATVLYFKLKQYLFVVNCPFIKLKDRNVFCIDFGRKDGRNLGMFAFLTNGTLAIHSG